MNCPNCGYTIELGSNNICPHCGVDAILFKKTVEASDILYNRGLAKVKTMDLTGAREHLEKSIQFNRANYTARNLLGLVCFETGHVGEALKHWVISSSQKKQDNPAVEYLDATQKDIRVLDKYNEAAKMYNQALVYLKQKSDDMAIIQLKRAVEICPKFIDALNMLALCYLIQKDRTKSLAVIERVLAVDANNSVALNYYNEVFPAKVRPEKALGAKKLPQSEVIHSTIAPLGTGRKKSIGRNFHIAEILSFVIGGICTFAVLYILMIPSMEEAWATDRTKLTDDKNLLEQTLNDTINDKENEIQQLTAERDSLASQKSELSAQLEMNKKIVMVNEAEQLNRDSDAIGAAVILYGMTTDGLPADIAERYNAVKEAVYPRAARQLYDNALRQFNDEAYEEARNMFLQALTYEALEERYAGDANYYLGYIAEANGDAVSARNYYDITINNYPRASQIANARRRVQNLSE